MSRANASDRLRVSVFDYGAGNLHSLIKTLERDDTLVRVDTDAESAVRECDALILPGVGAFTPAATRLASGGDAMRAALQGGLPCLGICLGMQLLFEASDEGSGVGLGVLSGRVRKLTAARIPQIGWNAVDDVTEPLLTASGLSMAYYANSFVAAPSTASLAQVVAWSEHEGDRFPAAVRAGRTIGTQFHPEKSSAAGVRFVHAFLDEARQALETR